MRRTPWTRIRRVPSGTRISLWTIAAVPTSYRSSQPGSSTSSFFDGDEREHPVAGDDVVDQLDRALLADRERRHRLREDDRLLQRQDRQDGRHLDVVLVEVTSGSSSLMRAPSVAEHDQMRPVRGLGASGITTVSSPRSYVASAPLGVDVLGERDPALERAVLDLHLPVGTRPRPRGRRARRAIDTVRSETTISTLLRVDAGELDDDRDSVGALGAEAVHVRPEAVAPPANPGTCQRSAKSSSSSSWIRSTSRRCMCRKSVPPVGGFTHRG